MPFLNAYTTHSKLITICVIAIILRVIWAVLIPIIPISDSVAYDTFAQNILTHGTFGWTGDRPTSFWPVGTSAIYSLIYLLFGHNYPAIAGFNILCTIAIIILSNLLCNRFFENKNIGLYTCIAIAIWPTLIAYTTILASELPYMAFLMGAFYFFTHPNNKKPILTACLAGGLFAAAYYIRPLAIITIAIGAFYLFINKQILTSVSRFLISLSILAILVSPWAYRNYTLYDAFIPMSTNGGATLWMGNQEHTDGGYVSTPPELAHLDEHSRNSLLKQQAIEYIKEQPLTFIYRTTQKFIIFHSRETIGISWNAEGIKKSFGEAYITPLKIITQLFWSLIMACSLAGVVLFIKHHGFWKTAFHPFILLWGSSAAIHAIIVSQDRYHIPVIPFITAFSAYFLCFLQVKFSPPKRDSMPHE